MRNLGNLIDDLSSLSPAEASGLVSTLETRWGVKAAKANVVAPPSAPAPVVEQKTEFTVMLTGSGANKINVIKEVRAITGLGLKEAKDLVDNLPKPVKEDIAKDEAATIKARLEKAGAVVVLT